MNIKIEEERISVTENEEVNKIAHLAGAFSHMLRNTIDGGDVRVGMVSPSFDQSINDPNNLSRSRERYLNTCMPSENVIKEDQTTFENA